MNIKSALIAAMITTVTITSLSLPSFAQAPVPERQESAVLYIENGVIITPFWVETSEATADISVSGKNVCPVMRVKANKTTTKISGMLYLEKLVSGSWQQVTSWPVSGTGVVNLSKSSAATTGITYRSRFVVTVGSEKIERSSSSCKA